LPSILGGKTPFSVAIKEKNSSSIEQALFLKNFKKRKYQRATPSTYSK
jgi:hypothetical protein